MARAPGEGGATGGGAGFNFVEQRLVEFYAPRRGELRQLRYTLQPDALRRIAQKPELGELIYHREVLLWVSRLEAQGYTLADKPEPARATVCLDRREPAGSRWMVVRARFRHHGPLGVLPGDDVVQLKEEMAAIGAKKDGGPGVARYLESLPPEEAERIVREGS